MPALHNGGHLIQSLSAGAAFGAGIGPTRSDQVLNFWLVRSVNWVAPDFFSIETVCELHVVFENLEVAKNKIVHEVEDFIRSHQSTFYQMLRSDVYGADEVALERVHHVVSILSKVWPYEENVEYGTKLKNE